MCVRACVCVCVAAVACGACSVLSPSNEDLKADLNEELSTQKLSTQKLSTQRALHSEALHSEALHSEALHSEALTLRSSRMHTPAIGTVSPVFGFRPSRAALSLESKVPNPTSDTLSPLATDSTITSRAARTRVGGGMNRFVVFVLLLEDVSVDASRSRRTPAPTSPPATHPPSPPWKRQLLLPTWGNRG